VSSMPDDSVIQEANRFPGERLIIARESKNMTQQSAADELHLPLRYIQWIEEGAFEKLPSLVFARGYIRSYAKVLDLDGVSLIESFDRQYGKSNSTTPIRSVSKVQEQVKLGDPMIKYSVWLFILAIVAVTVWWWKTQYGLSPETMPSAAEQTLSVETADGNTLVLPKFNDSEVTEETEETVSSDEPLTTEAEPEYMSDDQVASLQAELDAQPAAVSASDTSEPSATDATTTDEPASSEPVSASGVYIAFNDDCWVTIKDANGRTLFNNMRKAGESLNVDGPTPIRLTLGRQSAVSQITYNGDVIDLAPLSNNNISKFSLPLNR